MNVQRPAWPTLFRASAFGFVFAALLPTSIFAADPIRIGHVAALSGASAQSGEAITRGIALAIDEINAKGGLLGGRKLELIQRDDESSPSTRYSLPFFFTSSMRVAGPPSSWT